LIVLFLLVALVVIIWLWVSFQPTGDKRRNFTVEQITKDSTHPWFGLGSTTGFSIDGVQGKTLHLRKGVAYQFTLNAPNLRLYFTDQPRGGSGAPRKVSGTPDPFTGTETVTFPLNTPQIIYYNEGSCCQFVGGVIILR